MLRNVNAIAIGVVVLCFLLILVLPAILSQLSSCIEFTTESGAIGDTIGGITAPIIGLASAMLVFLGFYIQYDFNVKQQKRIERIENRDTVDRVNTEVDEFAAFFQEFKYDRHADRLYMGCQAWVLMMRDLEKHHKDNHWQSHDYSGYMEKLEMQWNNVLSSILSLKNPDRKQLLWKLVTELTILNNFFQEIQSTINTAPDSNDAFRKHLATINQTRTKMLTNWESCEKPEVEN